jgi:hypothetical protein
VAFSVTAAYDHKNVYESKSRWYLLALLAQLALAPDGTVGTSDVDTLGASCADTSTVANVAYENRTLYKKQVVLVPSGTFGASSASTFGTSGAGTFGTYGVCGHCGL